MIDSRHVGAAPGSTEKTVDAVPRRTHSQTLVPEALREHVDRIAIIGRLTASVEGTMMKGLQTGAPEPSFAADQQFLLVANGLAELLETARRELGRDQEMAKASLVTAGRILHSEIERYSGANRCPRAGLAGWQLLRVRAHIDCNLHHTIHIRDLCAVARRSPSHFSRQFKLAVGESPHAYVVRRRLEKACHLMITSTTSLSEIALCAGFSDQAHLSRHFRQVFRQSPARWRRERRMFGEVTSKTGTDEKSVCDQQC